MYKRQMRFQKILCYLTIIVSAAVFVYSLGITTDLYDSLYMTMRNPNDLTKTSVSGSIVYYTIQGFNQNLMLAGIALILMAVALFITNTHVRRRYYIGNYITTCVWAAAAIGVCAWAHVQIEYYKAQFLQIDFAALKEHAEMWNTLYTESTFWFDVHYVLFAIVIATAAVLVGNLIWKARLMKEEEALLKAQ